MAELLELDSLEILAIIDNELDPISQSPNPSVIQTGGLREVSRRSRLSPEDPRGPDVNEARMSNICCSAHGLSLLITGTLGGQNRTFLFDTGPEESAWERNALRLQSKISPIELIHLSHWHRDHSGGMLQALKMIYATRKLHDDILPPVQVDLHPGRPDYRGVQPPDQPVTSLEADPTFKEIELAGGVVGKSVQPHAILNGMFLVSGEIPRVTEYEVGLKYGVRFNMSEKKWEADEELADERFVMCKLNGKGIVVFTGCSHAGVVNVAKHAIELGDGSPLYAVVGGFHLADAEPERMHSTVRDLKALDVRVLLAGHCTGWRAKFEIQSQMPGCLAPSFVGSKYVL